MHITQELSIVVHGAQPRLAGDFNLPDIDWFSHTAYHYKILMDRGPVIQVNLVKLQFLATV